ncbi:hydroxyacylglutathione hydrolase [Rhodalgimonas zhirmunskyi]|uniref:Hydroxyacylglutathione hydrolase n=1 Tax=Rhodalgimonas zhirmunskyi TaxID=2964767 RepID=A0AAJ1X5B0_9RHOB|nr:hydroxyacylglutathione hydrolase [Rhodoalgimonas zhirmunskyi]MDQ2095078.1 hydroxyacylglutathione hydrolase [Rhodoalgimonas zhirmunskyi]
MPHELVTVACLSDNYAFLVHDTATGETAVIDVPEAAPILSALQERGWTATHILLTHHHADHVQGLREVLAAHPRAITAGARADEKRLPRLDIKLSENDTLTIGGERVEVIDVPGHTVGHIAYLFPQSHLLFTGDSLMALGCGRLFEGSPEQMFESLGKLRALPDETLVCSGHEYTTANGRFAATVDPENTALQERNAETDRLRAEGKFTVPSTLGLERATNPYLRCKDPSIRKTLNMDGASDLDIFTEIRRRKDNF